MKQKRIYALLLAVVIAASFCMPLTASAMDRVTIESDPDDATPRYFEYLNSSGQWEKLKTPRHYIVETGEIAYCLQHKMQFPAQLDHLMKKQSFRIGMIPARW